MPCGRPGAERDRSRGAAALRVSAGGARGAEWDTRPSPIEAVAVDETGGVVLGTWRGHSPGLPGIGPVSPGSRRNPTDRGPFWTGRPTDPVPQAELCCAGTNPAVQHRHGGKSPNTVLRAHPCSGLHGVLCIGQGRGSMPWDSRSPQALPSTLPLASGAAFWHRHPRSLVLAGAGSTHG